VSYITVGDDQFALKIGRLRAWIVLLPEADLRKRLNAPNWVATLFGAMRSRFAADPNIAELDASLKRFSAPIANGQHQVNRDKNGLTLRYSGSPAGWLAMEEAIRRMVLEHLQKTGQLIAFTTFNVALPFQKPFQEIIVGMPAPEQETNVREAPVSVVPSYTRLPLALIGVGIVGVVLLLMLLFGGGGQPEPVLSPTPTATLESAAQADATEPVTELTLEVTAEVTPEATADPDATAEPDAAVSE
jgi:hypothetical protein